MKKSLVVMILATALVFAFAAVAQARPNGNIYIKWSGAAPNNNTNPSTPHAGYTTATEKCNVCHSVHYAATSGFAWQDLSSMPAAGANAWTADTAETQMLLRSSVANACNYCHITTAVGGVQLYGGVVSNYTVDSRFAHNGPAAACSMCHAVHGAGTFQGANLSKILRVRTDKPIQPEVLADGVGRNPLVASLFATKALAVSESGDKYLQQVAFCSQCHAEYTDASESTITGGPGYYDGGAYIAGSEFKGHPLKGAEAADFQAAGDNLAGMPAAFAGSTTCRSCHDAGLVDQTGVTFNSFPHYTAGAFVFSRTSARTGASFDATDTAKDYATDGNCLKCHVNSAGTAGVGITY